MKSVNLKLNETASIYIVSGNGGYTVSTSNQNIVSASVNDNIITLQPLSKGTVTLSVTDKENKVATVTLTVKDPYLGIYVADRTVEVIVTDTDIRSAILKEITNSSSLELKYLYDFSKNNAKTYTLYKENWNAAAIGNGNYSFNDYELTLKNTSSSNVYIINKSDAVAKTFYEYFNSEATKSMIEDNITTRTSINESFFHITENLTDKYKTLYPDAGINTVKIVATVQLINYNYQY